MIASGFAFRYRFDPTPGFEYISPAVQDIVGYRPEDFYHDPDLDIRLVHPEDQAVFQELIRSPYQPYYLRCISRCGGTLWLEVNPIPILSDKGKLLAVDGLARVSDEHAARLQRSLGPMGDRAAPLPPLSIRELEVLDLAAQGWTDVQIGGALGISSRTVERHMRHVFFKFGVANRTAAVARLLRQRTL